MSDVTNGYISPPYIHIYTYTNIHTYINTYIQTYIHTYKFFYCLHVFTFCCVLVNSKR